MKKRCEQRPPASGIKPRPLQRHATSQQFAGEIPGNGGGRAAVWCGHSIRQYGTGSLAKLSRQLKSRVPAPASCAEQRLRASGGNEVLGSGTIFGSVCQGFVRRKVRLRSFYTAEVLDSEWRTQ